MLPGPVVTPQASRGHPSSYHHPVSALGSRSPFLASPTSPTARPVRRQLCRAHRLPAPHHLASSPRGAARATWTRRHIAARSPPVPIGAGWGGAISVPMDFLPFVNLNLSTSICQPQFVNPNLSIFTPSARLAHDACGWHHSRCDDAAWPSGYAAVDRQYCVRPGHAAVPSLATPHTRR